MNKSKPPKKTRPRNTSNGKAANLKGKAFEDTVADLYRLLGADVTRNIMIAHKKVDILAEFPIPGSKAKHRILVECKDEKKSVNQNQRVMEFRGLLDTARKADRADSAEIITQVPWSDQAKGYASLFPKRL